jgi:hypothetical protein
VPTLPGVGDEMDVRVFVGSSAFDPLTVASPAPVSGLAIVQFTGPLTPPDADRLRAAHGEHGLGPRAAGEGQLIGLLDDGPPDLGHCFFADAPNSPAPSHRKVVALRNLHELSSPRPGRS